MVPLAGAASQHAPGIIHDGVLDDDHCRAGSRLVPPRAHLGATRRRRHPCTSEDGGRRPPPAGWEGARDHVAPAPPVDVANSQPGGGGGHASRPRSAPPPGQAPRARLCEKGGLGVAGSWPASCNAALQRHAGSSWGVAIIGWWARSPPPHHRHSWRRPVRGCPHRQSRGGRVCSHSWAPLGMILLSIHERWGEGGLWNLGAAARLPRQAAAARRRQRLLRGALGGEHRPQRTAGSDVPHEHW